MTSSEILKNKILDLAMHGKLVKQDPNDEPASVLLTKIKAEKEQLIKAKKIKRTPQLPEITADEIPYQIPDSWQWVRLNDIGIWQAGSTPVRSKSFYYGGNIPWVKTGDLNDGEIKKTSETITEEGFNNSSVKLNPAGSILIAMYGATIGKLGILKINATTNQACCACIPFKEINNKYLFYYLLSQRSNLIRLGYGGAQPNISRTKIINYIISLPPLAEQQRIVAKIEKIFAELH